MCKTVKIFRHGETVWNKAGILQGWLDSPLTDTGKEQAKFPDFQPNIVYASDLGRANETARLMFPDKTIQTDQRLREIYLGEWQGKKITDLQKDIQYENYIKRPERFEPTTQETFHQVMKRMESFLQLLIDQPEDKIAVISHGVAIACLTIALQHKPLSTLWNEGIISGGQCITLTYSEKEWRIV